MDKFEGENIINDLEKYKVFQEKINESAPDGPKNKSLDWAQHYVRHYFGMETDNLGIDLYLEINHLNYFAEHLMTQDKAMLLNCYEVQIRIKDLIGALIKYREKWCKEDAEDD